MKRLEELLAGYQSVVLGTLGSNGYPFSSYAPFYYDGELLYIFISDMATHTKNIQTTPRASTLFIEDESKSENIFARKRISLQCDVTSVSKDEERFQTVMKQFQHKFDAPLVTMLMGLKDFNLYALKPLYGEATFGFGEAYHIGGEKMNELVTRSGENGHKR
ncbi:pyridoxamine 5'-phosphate oxidase family protein [Sulfurovum sp. XGS-02]|uniref:HugZ family pyridoxamine 5'-phosphate oxidase n=1 Tax=Sulfurovum sp. XGS-02 TaxID=2925411 RepID=UPI002052F910|nr:pyridoxamine 5'-phosphate oxidase family protein [Sulfurovum sp. XGS-02]UPT77833.1 pyridoxamine 5'-phosphate oxidase family protein [Sulfurovum sp. XGS-02]